MPSSEKEKLLQDILNGADYERFRADVLRASTHEFRRHHRKKSVRVVLGLAACLSAVVLSASVLLMAHRSNPLPAAQTGRFTPAPSQLTKPAVFEIVQSQPLPDSMVVRSVQDRRKVIDTIPLPPHSSLVFQTSQVRVPELDDSELIALFSRQPAGFIAYGHERRFILLGPPQSP